MAVRSARGRWFFVGAVLLLVALSALGATVVRARAQAAVLRGDPEMLLATPALRRTALARGEPVYQRYCSGCHGADGRGGHGNGVPDFTDDSHLYGQGRVAEIEEIARHGIRSGDGRGFALASMPAFGTAHPYAAEPLPSLTPGQIEDLTQYVLAFSGRATNVQAAQRGAALYRDYGGCYDCHGYNGEGDDAIGAPSLTDEAWLYGHGSHDDIAQTLVHGRAGISPAYGRVLNAAQLRDVAAYVASLEPAKPTASR